MGVGILHGFIPETASAFPLKLINSSLKKLCVNHLYNQADSRRFLFYHAPL